MPVTPENIINSFTYPTILTEKSLYSSMKETFFVDLTTVFLAQVNDASLDTLTNTTEANSSKDDALVHETSASDLLDLATTEEEELGAITGYADSSLSIDDNSSSSSTLYSSSKVEEVVSTLIDDSTESSSKAYSSEKLNSEIVNGGFGTLKAVASEDISDGDLVSLNSSGQVEITTTSNYATWIGISKGAYLTGSTATIYKLTDVADNLTGLSVDTKYYLDTATALLTTVETSYEVGIALTDTKLLITGV